MAKTRIACVQMDPIIGEPKYNREQIAEQIERTGTSSAQLVIFPECAVTGYCYDSLEEASRFAEAVDGPSFNAIAKVCSRAGCYAIAGFIEKDGADFYNSAMLVGPDGLAGTYHKVHLPYLGVD